MYQKFIKKKKKFLSKESKRNEHIVNQKVCMLLFNFLNSIFNKDALDIICVLKEISSDKEQKEKKLSNRYQSFIRY